MVISIASNRVTMIDPAEWPSLRRYLFAIAYRMLGSASDAEDVVHEAYLRVSDAGGERPRSVKAYLATVVTRLCLDELRSARTKREVYVGPWLPEPVPTEDLAAGPAESAERREELSLAFLLLLERLSPEERAIYVLREAFGYPFEEIAAMLDRPVTTVRQYAHRARERVQHDRPRFTALPQQHGDLVERFITAARTGDLDALTGMLTADAVAWTDGGARRRAARRPIHGADAVARGLIGAVAKFFGEARATIEDLNGGLVCLLWDGPDLVIAIAPELTADGRIAALHSVINPDKLAYLRRRLDERAGASELT